MNVSFTIAASLVTVIGLAAIGGGLMKKAPPADRIWLALIVLLLLPMNPLAYYVLRLPLDGVLSRLLVHHDELHRFFGVFYAPLTEEPAKLWLFLFPAMRHRVTRDNLVRVAVAIGLGFGIGEAWLVGHLLSRVPEYAQYPWYALTGFVGERLCVCLIHAGLTATALLFIVRRRWLRGMLAAMSLHYLANFPLYLARFLEPVFGKTVVVTLLGLWVSTILVSAIFYLARLAYGQEWRGRLFGWATCPECGERYERPLFARIMLGTWNYERCPHCRRWHLVKVDTSRVLFGGWGWVAMDEKDDVKSMTRS